MQLTNRWNRFVDNTVNLDLQFILQYRNLNQNSYFIDFSSDFNNIFPGPALGQSLSPEGAQVKQQV